MPRKQMLILVIALLLFPLSALLSDVQVTYEPVSRLKFEKGPYPFTTSHFVLKIGTITFTSTDNSLFDPTLFALDTPIHFGFTGPVTWYEQNGQPVYVQQETLFRMASVSTIKGQTGWNYMHSDDFQHGLADWKNGNINTNPFIAEIYLVSEQSASIYPDYASDPSTHGEYYTQTSGSFGGFNVVVADNNSGHYNGYEYVPVNGEEIPEDGSPPSSDTPFLEGGGTSPPPVIYENPDNPLPNVGYLLSIIEEPMFSIQDAYGINKTKIAEAHLTLQNAVSGSTYGVLVTFSDAEGSSIFSLHLDGERGLYPIPYQLLFNGEPVTGSVPLAWDGLSTTGINTRWIEVTGINQNRAEMAPSGVYLDTITIQIEPKDSL
ncbi:MAG: hypothetical protein AB7D92_07090 [Sphaerochaeta sp.]